MKRVIAILAVIIMFTLSGCPGGEEEKTDDNKIQVNKIEKAAATEFMDNYLRYVLKGDDMVVKSFYSSKVKELMKKDIPKSTEPHPVGYKIEGGEGEKGKMIMTVHLYSAYNGFPYFSDDTYKYTLILQKGKILIDKIDKEKSIEIYAQKNTLYKIEGEKVKGDKIIAIDELPFFVTSKGASEQKFPVPKDSFGPLAVSSKGKEIVITSMGENSFIAIIKMEEAEEASNIQGDEDKKKGEDQGQAGGEGEGKQQGQEAEKKPELSIKPVDLYFKTKVNSVSFSPDGKIFVVETIPKGGMNKLIIYTSQTGDIVKTNIEKQFKTESFYLKSPYFISKEELIFSVIPGENTTDEEKMLKGEWMLDIKSGKIKKIQ